MALPDSDDEDLKKAIALSLADAAAPPPHTANRSENSTSEAVPASQANPVLAGLNRKAMEEERLARLANKRQRSVSPPPLRSPRKAPKLEESTVTLPSGARLKSFSSLVNNEQTDRKSPAANAATQNLKHTPLDNGVEQEQQDGILRKPKPSPGAIRYPHGVVKKTWAFGFERDDDVKLEEVLEPSTLKTAVLSAFQWNTEWVLAKLKTPLNGGTTKCVFVMQAKEDTLRREMLQQTEGMRSFLRLCFPPMLGQINCMHSKLMLLFHPDKLRIAIPTANLLDFDWGETGMMENSVFMVDLPRLRNASKAAQRDDLTGFAREITHFMEKQGLDQDIQDGILNFDFSTTSEMAFVHTAGGASFGNDAERTGLLGLAKSVRKLDLQTNDDLEIDFAASSIGSLNNDYLQHLHSAARGQDLPALLGEKASKAKSSFFAPSATKPKASSKAIRDLIRIYFPTHNTVRSSKAGAAGTICLSRRWFESATFPRSVFRDYNSTRTGLLSHNKILYARGMQDLSGGNGKAVKDVAWAYVGSANMSESAWGKVVFDQKAKAWKINCRNWECGVLLPVPAERLDRVEKAPVAVKKEKVEGDDSETESDVEDDAARLSKKKTSQPGLHANGGGNGASGSNGNSPAQKLVGYDVFDGVVKPPFQIPAKRYDGKQPWYFQEHTQE